MKNFENRLQSIQTRTLSIPTDPPTKVFPVVDRAESVLGGNSVSFIANHATETFTSESHGFVDNDIVLLRTTGSLPSGLALETLYHIISATADTFQLSATSGGAAVAISDNGDGVQSCDFATYNPFKWQYHELSNSDSCVVRIDPTDGNYATAVVYARKDGFPGGRYSGKYLAGNDYINSESATGWVRIDKDSPLVVHGDKDLSRLRLFASSSAVIVAVEATTTAKVGSSL